MPLYFSSIIREHRAVRGSAGIFDVSHMGKIYLNGVDIAERLQGLLPNTVPRKEGVCRYTHLLDEKGRIIDDVIISCLRVDEYLCVCNAGPTSRVVSWFRWWLGDSETRDLTHDLVCLALQGPRSETVLQPLVSADLGKLRSFRGVTTEFTGDIQGLDSLPVEIEGWASLPSLLDWDGANNHKTIYITRTGYTGEDGFEIFAPNELGKAIWSAVVLSDTGVRVIPAGLAARDTLRLEKGYLLSGQDFDGEQTPLEVGYDWLVKWDHDFVGRSQLLQLRRKGGFTRLMGVRLESKGVPRRGNRIYWEGKEVGFLTSATLSPTLKAGIGLGYLQPEACVEGRQVELDIRGTRHRAQVVKPPFV